MSEGRIQDEIRLALSQLGIVTWRNNCGVAITDNRTIRYGLAVGSADLIGCHRGRFLAIEIKTPIGKQRPEQKLFQQLVEANGGIYVILRSAEEATLWVRNELL